MLLLAAFTVVGLLALAPAYAWELSQGRTISVSPGALAGIAYTGIFPGFLGYVFYNRAVGEVGASKASLFLHLMPVFATILSAIFLAETPQPYHYLGIALIFAGIYMTTAARGRRERHDRQAARLAEEPPRTCTHPRGTVARRQLATAFSPVSTATSDCACGGWPRSSSPRRSSPPSAASN
jgi:uncharacterized membrane protein